MSFVYLHVSVRVPLRGRLGLRQLSRAAGTHLHGKVKEWGECERANCGMSCFGTTGLCSSISVMQIVSLESRCLSVFQFTTKAPGNSQVQPVTGPGCNKGNPQQIKCCCVSGLSRRLIFSHFTLSFRPVSQQRLHLHSKAAVR